LAPIVTEGQRLQFTVSAYDLDGDFVTITASGLPSHSSFPDVTGDSSVSGTLPLNPDFNRAECLFCSIYSRDALGVNQPDHS
jgi:hypothetical protein